MAFNWQTFRTRALTAIVFVVVMMGGLLWNRWSFFLLFSVVHFGCWIEYQRLVQAFHKAYGTILPIHKYGVMLAGWLVMLSFANTTFVQQSLWLWLALVLVILILLADVISKRANIINWAYSFFGLVYISLSLALFVGLRNQWQPGNDLNIAIPLLIVFSIWINDTMAYIVGSIIGKTPLSKISPKKTWEGTIGGIILAVLVMGGIAYTTNYIKPCPAMVMAGIAAVTGTFGDLFESKLKRMAGVKDSGRIMPGHGGFLDRFDSLLFATVFVWIYVVAFYKG